MHLSSAYVAYVLTDKVLVEWPDSLGIITFLTVANPRENSESDLGHLLPV